jgi:hypothetical protein
VEWKSAYDVGIKAADGVTIHVKGEKPVKLAAHRERR